ncbi:DUF975 family protein [Neobacillus mesonae]|nr:DUF975 family protein [Neobacillus mesonae]
MNISIMDIKQRALDSLKGIWGRAIMVTVIIGVLTIILPLVIDIRSSGGFEFWLLEEDSSSRFNFFRIVLEIVLIPFSAGVMWFYLDIVRRYDSWLTEIFAVYKDGAMTLKLIWTSIVTVFFLVLWTLLLVIPGMIKSLAYSQTTFILKDHPEYSATQAITESRRLMYGNKWKYVLFLLSFIGWMLLTAVTFGLAGLFVGPYFYAAQAAFYDELKKNDEESTIPFPT